MVVVHDPEKFYLKTVVFIQIEEQKFSRINKTYCWLLLYTSNTIRVDYSFPHVVLLMNLRTPVLD
jgi:hypothetical protein